ncbi:hypothetical protein O6P43_026565 [Quillaja saponaria]|uniref:Uncharacterized protein n=1 Tax=Quillaja saponaria TaxID=32244 RepID=A0AAD7L2V3_QUISA|nr:hypothetical protein O6P43_026565 [Quillaja saponaria]
MASKEERTAICNSFMCYPYFRSFFFFSYVFVLSSISISGFVRQFDQFGSITVKLFHGLHNQNFFILLSGFQ